MIFHCSCVNAISINNKSLKASPIKGFIIIGNVDNWVNARRRRERDEDDDDDDDASSSSLALTNDWNLSLKKRAKEKNLKKYEKGFSDIIMNVIE